MDKWRAELSPYLKDFAPGYLGESELFEHFHAGHVAHLDLGLEPRNANLLTAVPKHKAHGLITEVLPSRSEILCDSLIK